MNTMKFLRKKGQKYIFLTNIDSNENVLDRKHDLVEFKNGLFDVSESQRS
jgi:ribonucleotide monophosphatase NagD (HAD superfamily)